MFHPRKPSQSGGLLEPPFNPRIAMAITPTETRPDQRMSYAGLW